MAAGLGRIRLLVQAPQRPTEMCEAFADLAVTSGRRWHERSKAARRMPEPARLHPADVELIARRSAELVLIALESRPPSDESSLVDATEIAQRFGVDRGWVYAHADELGAVRLGTGRKPRLRFNAAVVERALTSPPATSDDGSARAAARAIVADGAVRGGLDALPAAWRQAASGGKAA